MTVSITRITGADAEIVARLHATSWKNTYRGILSDEYLDTRADGERVVYWRERLSRPEPNAFGFIAWHGNETGRTPVGFCFVVVDDDTQFGSLLDNLHVLPEAKGLGIGRGLISAIADELRARKADMALYLFVYEDNIGARGFYDHICGQAVERIIVTTLDGGQAAQWRYYWPDCSSV